MIQQYIHYVLERQAVYERRAAGEPAPWTDDPALRGWRFCNNFRVLDAGTQFLLGEVLSDGAPLEDRMMRCFLYRYNNRPEPWQFFAAEVGRMPLIEDLETGLLQDTWLEYRDLGGKIVGGAYQMFVGQENKGLGRAEWLMGLTAQTFCPTGGSPRHYVGGWGWSQVGIHYILPELMERLWRAEAMFRSLIQVPRCSSFMAQQILTDMSYLDESEMTDSDHVVPGPGARRGLRNVFPGVPSEEGLQRAVDIWDIHLSAPFLVLPDGRRHYLSRMDIQNTFCEFQKYLRRITEEGRPRTFKPSHPQEAWSSPVLPRSW